MEREDYMGLALELAREAAEDGDVPVGCVVVKNGEIIGRGRNRRERDGDATAHAELEAIRDACRKTGSWRLEGTELYVTLEPCPMCAGGILNARVGTLCFGARDARAGSCGSVIDLFGENYGFHPRVYAGVLEEECAGVLARFFGGLRERDGGRKAPKDET